MTDPQCCPVDVNGRHEASDTILRQLLLYITPFRTLGFLPVTVALKRLNVDGHCSPACRLPSFVSSQDLDRVLDRCTDSQRPFDAATSGHPQALVRSDDETEE